MVSCYVIPKFFTCGKKKRNERQFFFQIICPGINLNLLRLLSVNALKNSKWKILSGCSLQKVIELRKLKTHNVYLEFN